MKVYKVWDKLELFIMSLWFLFFLIIVITVDVPFCFGDSCTFIGFKELFFRNIVPGVALIFVLAGAIFYFRFDYRLSGSKSIPSEIIKINDLNYEHLTFLTTYIIPLIFFDFTSVRYLIALALLLVVIGIIYVKTDKFYANPTLAILGFKLYKVDIKTRTGVKEGIVVITKDRLSISDQIKSLKLDEEVLFARKL